MCEKSDSKFQIGPLNSIVVPKRSSARCDVIFKGENKECITEYDLIVDMLMKPEDRAMIEHKDNMNEVSNEDETSDKEPITYKYSDGLWIDAPETLQQNRLRLTLRAESILPSITIDPNPFNNDRSEPEPIQFIVKATRDEYCREIKRNST
eukprot:UN24094